MISCIKSFIYTYIYCYEGAATLLVFFILFLKLHLGREVLFIDRKEMIISIPAEIAILVLGFQLSNIINIPLNESTNSKSMTEIICSLIVLGIQVVSEREIKDKLSGKLEFKVVFKILLMFLLSMCLYVYEIYGGI